MTNDLPYTVIDNFLDYEDFLEIKKLVVENDSFPWFLTENVTGREEDEGKDCYFTHLFVKDYKANSHLLDHMKIFVDKLNMKEVIRIKANLYPATQTLFTHGNHVDYHFKNKAAVFCLNTCNGFTIIQDKYKIESVENRIILFEGSDLHCSTTCTDKLYRVNLNFNYF